MLWPSGKPGQLRTLGIFEVRQAEHVGGDGVSLAHTQHALDELDAALLYAGVAAFEEPPYARKPPGALRRLSIE